MLTLNKNTIIYQNDIDEYYQKMVNYHKEAYPNDRHKPNKDEAIAIEILKANDIHGVWMDGVLDQLIKWDIEFTIDNKVIDADIKHCFTHSNHKKWFVACDIEYYKCDEMGNPILDNKRYYTPYNQNNTDDSLGWVFHLEECDMLMLINKSKGVMFTIENFQAMREIFIEYHINGSIPFSRSKLYEYISTDPVYKDIYPKKKLTKTFYLNLEDEWLHQQLGITVTKYNFIIR